MSETLKEENAALYDDIYILKEEANALQSQVDIAKQYLIGTEASIKRADRRLSEVTAERDRYREALEKIAYQLNKNDGSGEGWLRKRLLECRLGALEALKEKP